MTATAIQTAEPGSALGRAVPSRVPGVRLLGRYEGGGYVEDRYLVMRPDGQTAMLTRLAYLVVRYADGGRTADTVAELVSRDYGSRLSPQLLAHLVDDRLAPAGVMRPLTRDAQPSVMPRPAATAAATPQVPRHASRRGPATTPKADPLLSVTLDRAFMSTRAVRRFAGWLSPMFHPLVIVATLAGFVASDLWLLRGALAAAEQTGALTQPTDILAVIALLGLGTLLHELGHAAGCRYGGGRPGAIGAGMYLWLPVFWTDVTDAYRLDRRGRLRTDLGGVYFNAVFVVLATAGFAATRWLPLAVAALLTNLTAVQQLVPVVRLDGYYILGDLTGVPNLFGLMMPILRSAVPGRPTDPRVTALRPGTRVVVALWVVVTLAAMTGSLVGLVLGGPALLGSTWSQLRGLWASASSPSHLAAATLAWLCLGLILLPFVGFAALLLRTVTMATRRLGASAAPAPADRPNLVYTSNRQEPDMTYATDVTPQDAPPSPQAQDVVAGPWAARPGSPPTAGIDTLGRGSDHAGTRPPAVQHDVRRAPNAPPIPEPAPDPPRLSAADFTEDAILRPRRTAPKTGWRRGVFMATGGVIQPGPSAQERREAELIARVRTPVHGSRRIVILSRKGGAGKTTTTLMLGHTLAMHRGDRVIALDANPDAGSLPYRVERESDATVTTLLAEVDRAASYSQVRAHTSQAPTRLEIVASDDDPRITTALGETDYRKAIDLLDRHYMLMLLDTGTGILDDATQGILREADQVVVVMPAALDGARVAASTLDWLDEHRYDDLVRSAVAVINGVRDEGGLVQLDAIEAHFRARCSAVVQIPWDRALEAGGRTGPDELRTSTRQAYLELAAAVAEGFSAPPARRS